MVISSYKILMEIRGLQLEIESLITKQQLKKSDVKSIGQDISKLQNQRDTKIKEPIVKDTLTFDRK